MRALFFLVTMGGSLLALWAFVWALLTVIRNNSRASLPQRVKPRSDGTAVITAGASIPVVPLILAGVVHDTQITGATVFFCSALYTVAAIVFIIFTLCTRTVVFPWDMSDEGVDKTGRNR